MESAVRLAWCVLGLVHVMPAAATFSPSLQRRLYGAVATGDLGLLVAHRGALFCAIIAACACGVVDIAARRALGIVVAISVVGFLILFVRARPRPAALRRVALADALALGPLTFVLWAAWQRQEA